MTTTRRALLSKAIRVAGAGLLALVLATTAACGQTDRTDGSDYDGGPVVPAPGQEDDGDN